MTSLNAVPLGQPLVGASFGQAVRRFFRQYVGFTGRASRSEFWWAFLFVQLLLLVPMLLLMAAMLSLLPAIIASSEAAAGMPDAVDPVGIIAASGSIIVISGLVTLVSLGLALPFYAALWRRLQDANFHGAFALLGLVGLSIVPLILALMPSSPAGIRFDPVSGAAAWGQPAYGGAPYGQAPNPTAPYAPHTGVVPAAYPQPDAPFGGASYGSGVYGQPTEQPYGPPPSSGPYDEPTEPPRG